MSTTAPESGQGTTDQANTGTAEGTQQDAAAQGQQGQQGQDTNENEDKGKGGKAAVLADLAKERDKRQAAEAQASQTTEQLKSIMLTVGKALGIKVEGEEAPTAEALQASLVKAQEEAQDSARLLTVYQVAASPDVLADPAKIMNLVSVRDQLKGVDPSDTAKITEVIKAAVTDNPYVKLTPPGAGAGDAGASGRDSAAKGDMNAWIRAAAGR